MTNSSAILSTAIQAAKAAGDVINDSASKLSSLKVEQKSLHDYVSEVDRNCESLIASIVANDFPDHHFIGEEFGASGDAGNAYQWVVDPLDGTTNFLRSIPHYAVSIAVLKNRKVLHAVVYDPYKDELFSASRGQGAWLNGVQLEVSQRPSFAGSLLATGVPFSGQNLAEVEAFNSTMLALLAQQTSGIRRLGSAALDLAYVAAGRYDGYWEANLNCWDIAAGVLLVQEAGGYVQDFAGGYEYLQSGDIVAACPAVIDDIIAITCKHYSR